MRGTSYVSVTDLFCGAGGSSLGATQAGAEVRTALNHWRLAIETHNSNFPDTDHDCTDISACNPDRYPSTTILIASPECVNHSLAKGAKRKKAQMSLFEYGRLDKDKLAAADRSRATMWDVCRFTERHRYQAVIVENVPDARHWELWDAWIMAMQLLGYEHEVVYFNSMFAPPTPQSRNRMYVVFWRKGNQKPDLRYYPPAWCTPCGQHVESVQSWKNPMKKWGKYREQYDYRCPRCTRVVEPSYHPAWTAIDWSVPAPRIGDRKKPLAPKTRARIAFGLKKFARPMQINVTQKVEQVADLGGPMFTQVGSEKYALATPFLTSPNHRSLRAVSVGQAHPTQTASWRHALVDPFLVGFTRSHERHNRRSTPTGQPFPTQTSEEEVALTVPPFIAELRNNSTAREVSEPLATVTAGAQHHGLTVPPAYLVANYSPGYVRSVGGPTGAITTADHHALLTTPWLTSYYGTDRGHSIGEALPTVDTRDRHAVVAPPFIASQYNGRHAVADVGGVLPTIPTWKIHYLAQPGELPEVDDCGFRMLSDREIGAAMAFPAQYKVLGNKEDRIRQFGNAVTPPVLRWIVGRVLATLGGGA